MESFTYEVSPGGDVRYEIVPAGSFSIYPEQVNLVPSEYPPILIWLVRSILLLRVNKYGKLLQQSVIDGLPSNSGFIRRLEVGPGPRPEVALHRIQRLIQRNLPFSDYSQFPYSVYYQRNQAFQIVEDHLVDPITRRRVRDNGELVIELISNVRVQSPELDIQPGEVRLMDGGQTLDSQQYRTERTEVLPLTLRSGSLGAATPTAAISVSDMMRQLRTGIPPGALEAQTFNQPGMVSPVPVGVLPQPRIGPLSSGLRGDVMTINRQASLHDGPTFSFPVRLSTVPYNADFDGDETNVHFPEGPIQDILSRGFRGVSANIYQTPRYGDVFHRATIPTKPAPIITPTQIGDYSLISPEKYAEIEPSIVRIDENPGFATDRTGQFLTLIDGRKFFLPQ